MTPGDDYLWDRSGEDPEVERLEGLLGGLAHDAPMRPLTPRRRSRRLAIGFAIGAAVAAVAVIALVVIGRDPARPEVAAAGCADGGPGFRFAVSGDDARCGGAAARGGVLPVGAWLETARGSEAAVRIADIGELTLLGGSRLRAVATGPQQHRLELERGTLRARVSAPPRLFVVDTPHAAAVDLGCAYELSVDEQGRTRLVVTSGVVSLEGAGRSAYVPAGAEVMTVGGGPGTPVRHDAPARLRDAVARWDAGDRSALPAVIAATEDCDTITLWNLLARTRDDDRRAVFEQLDRFSIRPEVVLTEEVLAGNPEAIERWRLELEATWLGLTPPATMCTGRPEDGAVDPHLAPPSKAPPSKPSPSPSKPSPPSPEQPPAPGAGETWSPPASEAPVSTPDDAAPATWR